VFADIGLEDLGHVEVSQLDLPRLGHEYICGLEVSVKDVGRVKSLQPLQNLDEVEPDFGLLKVLLLLPNPLLKVSPLGKLHDQTQVLRAVVKEGLLVADHIGMSQVKSTYSIEARIQISLRAFSFSFCDKSLILTVLSAYVLPSSLRMTRYTLEYAPFPSFEMILKLFIS